MNWTSAGLVVAALLQAGPADAFRWPWEQPVHYHRHHARPPEAPEPTPEATPAPNNCDRINESVKTLTPKNLKRALDDSNKKQRKTIDDCARQGESGR